MGSSRPPSLSRGQATRIAGPNARGPCGTPNSLGRHGRAQRLGFTVVLPRRPVQGTAGAGQRSSNTATACGRCTPGLRPGECTWACDGPPSQYARRPRPPCTPPSAVTDRSNACHGATPSLPAGPLRPCGDGRAHGRQPQARAPGLRRRAPPNRLAASRQPGAAPEDESSDDESLPVEAWQEAAPAPYPAFDLPATSYSGYGDAGYGFAPTDDEYGGALGVVLALDHRRERLSLLRLRCR